MTTKRQPFSSLFNSKVQSAQVMKRPLNSVLSPFGDHSGVVVRTNTGSYLVHKGDGFGRTNQTVVVPDPNVHMSDQWMNVGPSFDPGCTIGDVVKAMGSNYNVLFDNCNQSIERIPNAPVVSSWNRIYSVNEN